MAARESPPGLGPQEPPPRKRSRSTTSAPPLSTRAPLGTITEGRSAETPGRAPSQARHPERRAESRSSTSRFASPRGRP
eukprot:1599654-Alexandrium_andersonii.AAC.1